MSLLAQLDPSRLGSLRLRARVVVDGALSGLHRSPHHGSSVEFAEHKEYSPGDDLRHIDWKAWARYDRLTVKRFEQETELSAYLVLDRSGSMAYGAGPRKLDSAALLAAALAYLLIRQQDRVGLLGAGGPPLYVPPRARASHLKDLFDVLEDVVAAGGAGPTLLAATLERLGELARRRSLVVVLSDLFDPSPDLVPVLRRLRARGHDVVVFQTLDADELSLPFSGATLFTSLEDGRELLADPAAIGAAYLAELGGFLTAIRSGCTAAGVEHHLVVPGRATPFAGLVPAAAVEDALGSFLGGRARRALPRSA